jgi:Pyruvate/2-oxoacid:ferredoxin oxidoreductase gamma subunit
MLNRPLLSRNDAALNVERVKALTAKYGERTPIVAVAALSALTQLVPPETLEEALLAAQCSVLLVKPDGKIEELESSK